MQTHIYEQRALLAEGPGVTRMIKIFFSLFNPQAPMSVHKKFQPIRSNHLVDHTIGNII